MIMTMPIRTTLVLSVLTLLCGTASAQLRVATWNISNYSGEASLTAPIQTAVYGSFNGRSFRPDILCVQEVESAAALTTLRNALNSAPGSPGDWAAGPFVNGADTDGVVLYRTSRATLIASTTIALGSSDTTNQPRNTYRYDLRPIGYGANPANTIAIYNVHMKAGDTGTDQSRRLVEAQRIRDNAQGIETNGPGSAMPAGYQIIVLGDFNWQNSSQAAYIELTGVQASNLGRFFDPIARPGNWNNNPSFSVIHTQDPATQMDDRLDTILIGGPLLDGVGIEYIGTLISPQNPVPFDLSTWNDPNHSYRCWGNDGGSYNTTLRTTTNTMVGPIIAQALIDCTSGGGHLPVFLDVRMPARINSETLLDFGTVTQGRAAPMRILNVTNNGDTALWTAAGLDTLEYTLPPASGFTVPTGSYTDAPGGTGNTHTISMPTSALGFRTSSLIITSNDPDRPTRTVTLRGTVVANIAPIARAGADITIEDADNSGSEPVSVSGAASTDADGTITNFAWSLGPTILASGPTPSATLTLPQGTSIVTLTVTDDLGAIGTDTITIEVTGASSCDYDFNQDENIDLLDAQQMAQVFVGLISPEATWLDGDLNGDENADLTDAQILAAYVVTGTCGV